MLLTGRGPSILEEYNLAMRHPGAYCESMVALTQKKPEKHGLFHCLFDAETLVYVLSGLQRDLLTSHLKFETRDL